MSGRSRYVFTILLLVALAVLFASPSIAGGDDLSFARALVDARHYDLARALYERIAADTSRAPEERDEARLGRVHVPLAASAWARENGQSDAAARLADQALEAARRIAADAPLLLYRARFARARLRVEATKELEEVASLVEDLRETHEDTAEGRDAEQLLGEVLWEQARRTKDAKAAKDLYEIAFACFVGGLEGSAREPGYVQRIARAYRHLAEVALEASDSEIQHTALGTLNEMPKHRPTVRRTEDGARAWIAWSRLLCRAGDAERAIDVAWAAEEHASREARVAAQQAQLDCLWVQARAVRSPDHLRRLGDLHFAREDYRAAIVAYGRVILATADTSTDFLAWRWHAWERIAQAYAGLGDRLAEALAYEPIHEAWIRGWIPREQAADGWSLLLRAANSRNRSRRALLAIATRVDSEVFYEYERRIRDRIWRDYPGTLHIDGLMNMAVDTWKRAHEMRQQGHDDWRLKFEEAHHYFRQVSEDPEHPRSDDAWVYRIRAMWILDRFEDALAEAEQARALWDSEAARKRAATYESLRRRQASAQAAASFWTARALVDLDRNAETLPHLEGYAERHPSASEPYPLLARLLLLYAYAHLGDEAGATRALADLREAHPDWVQEGGPRPLAELTKVQGPRGPLLLANVLHGARMWDQARAFYAAYLSHPSIAARPESDPDKRLARLQLAWVLLALDLEAADRAVRLPYLGHARRTLERVLTNDPADRELIDAMLANRIVVLKIFVSGVMERVPVPVCTSIDQLRRRLHAIAERTDDAEKRHILFQQAESKDEMLEHLLPSAGQSLFDPDLYLDLANIDPLFRLTLARVHARSPNPDDEWRAWNLVQSLIHPPIAVAEDTDVWWQARALDGELRVRRALKAVHSIWGGTSRYTPEVPEGALDSTPFLREDR